MKKFAVTLMMVASAAGCAAPAPAAEITPAVASDDAGVDDKTAVTFAEFNTKAQYISGTYTLRCADTAVRVVSISNRLRSTDITGAYWARSGVRNNQAYVDYTGVVDFSKIYTRIGFSAFCNRVLPEHRKR